MVVFACRDFQCYACHFFHDGIGAKENLYVFRHILRNILRVIL